MSLSSAIKIFIAFQHKQQMRASALWSSGPIFIKVLVHLHLKPVYEFLRYA